MAMLTTLPRSKHNNMKYGNNWSQLNVNCIQCMCLLLAIDSNVSDSDDGLTRLHSASLLQAQSSKIAVKITAAVFANTP